jgi:hypothetical protein
MVQPFNFGLENYNYAEFYGVIASQFQIMSIVDVDLWTYWTKLTLTYNTTGSESYVEYYVNGSKFGESYGGGKMMQWDEDTFLALGGYLVSPTNTIIQDRFIGVYSI